MYFNEVGIVKVAKSAFVLLASCLLFSCNESDKFAEINTAFGLADKCYVFKHQNKPMGAEYESNQQDLIGYSFSKKSDQPSYMFVTATDLGQYLIFGDEGKRYLQAKDDGSGIDYVKTLASEVTMPKQGETHMLLSPAEWKFEQTTGANEYNLYNLTTKKWLVIDKSGNLFLSPAKTNDNYSTTIRLEGVDRDFCKNFPESEINAEGSIKHKTWPNGDLWGIANSHEHLMQGFSSSENYIHGTAFHKLGIEHALSDCEKHHGKGGTGNLFRYPGITPGYGNTIEPDIIGVLTSVVTKEPQYDTSGYPDLTYWPAIDSITHQTTYYKWIERAYLGGVRLITEYMEASKVTCDVINVIVPMPFQTRSCDEMENVDRGIERLKHMERYIDAKNGGKGNGWFRLVYSASEARSVIASGKLAVIIGLEIKSPFNCNLKGEGSCTESYVQEQLDKYYDKGVRAIFPTHKFHNAFGTGDGTTGFIEVFELLSSGQFRDYIACDDTRGEELSVYESHKLNSLFTINAPAEKVTPAQKLIKSDEVINVINDIFNKLNRKDLVQSKVNVGGVVFPIYTYEPSGHCQRAGMTELGKKFTKMLMKKGMIIDSSHYGTNSLADAFELYEKYEYPPVMTHGNNYQGKLLDLGGIQTTSFMNNCEGEEFSVEEKHMEYKENYQTVIDHPSAYKALAIMNDFNGLAPLPRPRYGDNAQCKNPQNPASMVKYPFKTYGGDFVMDKQVTGNRTFNINNDGLVTIGLIPDLIEQERLKGLTDDMLETMFRGAEGYVRAWEIMERKGKNVD